MTTKTTSAKKSGLAPGTLVHIGAVHEYEHRITVVNYNTQLFEKREIKDIADLLAYQSRDTVTWVIVEGLTDVATIDAIGQHFAIHPLVLEDVVNTHQRTKFEEYNDYLYFVLKAVSLSEGSFNIQYEQVSIVVLKNVVFAFMEKPDGLFAPILNRLENDKSHARTDGTDYLAYMIMDAVVDEYFTLQDSLDELVEGIEEQLLHKPSTDTLADIQKLRRELIFLRKTAAPLREILAAIRRSESPLFDEHTKRYFADIYDHSIRIIEALESYRELTSSMLDIYLSSISNKMNETMRFLTAYAAIFIPLTFLAGVYGMNFENMPELKWYWGYYTLWGLFIVIAVALFYYFKKHKWL